MEDSMDDQELLAAMDLFERKSIKELQYFEPKQNRTGACNQLSELNNNYNSESKALIITEIPNSPVKSTKPSKYSPPLLSSSSSRAQSTLENTSLEMNYSKRQKSSTLNNSTCCSPSKNIHHYFHKLDSTSRSHQHLSRDANYGELIKKQNFSGNLMTSHARNSVQERREDFKRESSNITSNSSLNFQQNATRPPLLQLPDTSHSDEIMMKQRHIGMPLSLSLKDNEQGRMQEHIKHRCSNFSFNSNSNSKFNVNSNIRQDANRSPLIQLGSSKRNLIYASEKVEMLPPYSASKSPSLELQLCDDGDMGYVNHHSSIVTYEEGIPPSEKSWVSGICSSLKFKDTQKEAMEILEKGDYTLLQGKPYIKKSGWRKIAFFYNLSFEIKDKNIDADSNGNVLRAQFVVRATMQNGRFAEAFGCCDRSERRFSKPHHEIPAIAETRAKNRASQDLLGIGECKF